MVAGDSVYFQGYAFDDAGNAVNWLGAYSTVDGSEQWAACMGPDDGGVLAGLMPDGGVVLGMYYADGGDFYPPLGLAVFDPPGVLRWQNILVTPPDPLTTPAYLGGVAVGAEGTIYVISDVVQLFAVNGNDGGIFWTYGNDAGARAESDPVIGADGTIYFMDHNGYLNAVR